MKFWRIPIVVAFLLGLTTSQLHAATYNFLWIGDPTLDPHLISATDPAARAQGTIELSAAAGESFDFNDIISVSIQVSGSEFESFAIDQLQALTGTIAADGLTASIINLLYNDSEIFGCTSPDSDCDFVTPGRNIGIVLGKDVFNYTYSSAAAAQSAYKLTAVSAVPIPAALPLLGLALAGLGGVAYHKRRNLRGMVK